MCLFFYYWLHMPLSAILYYVEIPLLKKLKPTIFTAHAFRSFRSSSLKKKTRHFNLRVQNIKWKTNSFFVLDQKLSLLPFINKMIFKVLVQTWMCILKV